MQRITHLWIELDRLRRNERGQDLVEYALLVGLLAVGMGLFAPDLTAGMTTIYSRLAAKLAQAAT